MQLPFQWRVTRYNPVLRNEQGHYPLDEWSSFLAVGKVFNGEPFTYEQYLWYESAYAKSTVDFLTDAHLQSLFISYLENQGIGMRDDARLEGISIAPDSLKVGSKIRREDLEDVVRLNLREVIWCKLKSRGQFYLHFGWDFYMYIGSTSPSLSAIHNAESRGLFVEPMKSPYL